MIRIQLLRNTELNSLLTDSDFLNTWKNLAKQTTGFHVLQEPEFILTWYRHYQAQYEPILLLGMDEKNTLVGLMALAWDEENQILTHGGHFSAEYHAWLAKPLYSDEFFAQCLLTVKQHFSLKKWAWNFMPPHLDFHVSASKEKELQKAGIFLAFKEEENPLWNLKDETKLKKTLKSSSLRSKRNRLKRRGELRFEIIQEVGRAKEALEVAAKQYDFRKEAQYNTRPYEEDLRLIDFDLDLIDQQKCLHCCALWLDDKLLAFHRGATDGKSVQLGLITFDPSEYASSPGTILFAELAKSLTEEGYETFDITPGGDAYKQRYANSSVLIKRPTVYFSRAEYEKGQLRDKIKNFLLQKGLLAKTKVLGKALKENPLNLVHAGAVFSGKNSSGMQLMQVYRNRFAPNMWQHLDISLQNYEDLLAYKDNCPYRSRRELLLDAYEKFKQSECLFSAKTRQGLLAFGWKKVLKKEAWIGGEQLEAGTILLYDFYFKSQAIRGVAFQAILHRMLSNISTDKPVYVMLKNEEVFLLEENLEAKKNILEIA